MAYRGLTNKQFNLVKDAAGQICKAKKLTTIGDYKRIGNLIIDRLESGEITYGDLLQDEIPFLAEQPKE